MREEFRRGSRIGANRVTFSDKGPAVIIGASGESFDPWGLTLGNDPVTASHLVQLSLIQDLQDGQHEVVPPPVSPSVHCFEGVEKQQQLLEMVHREPVVNAVKRMGAGMSNAFSPEILV